MNNTVDILCRLCAAYTSLNKLINLQTDEAKCEEILAKLTLFNVQVDLNDNVLPKVVCLTCFNSLCRAYDFITAIEVAQAALNDLILEKKIKKENYVSYDENFGNDEVSVSHEADGTVTLKSEESLNHEADGTVTLRSEESLSHEADGTVKLESEESDNSLTSASNRKSLKKSKKKSCNSSGTSPLSESQLTWDDYSWLCSYCDTQFPNINELRIHSMQYHSACNPYRCTECNRKKLRLDTFLMHVKRHRKYLKYSCYKCPQKFTSQIQGAQHRVTHLNSSYICFGCNSNFPNQHELYKHASVYYKGQSKSKYILMAMGSDGLTCKVCGKTFSTKGILSAHVVIHTDRKREYICEICGKSYYLKKSLEEHMLGHLGIRPFQCEICKSTFKTKRMLHSHAGVHEGKKPFACKECGRCFRLKRQLVNHSIIHTDSLPFVCSYCNKAFRFRSILNLHIRQHTGVKPYSCDICKRDFTNWPNYNKHMKRRHGMNMSKRKIVDESLDPVTVDT